MELFPFKTKNIVFAGQHGIVWEGVLLKEEKWQHKVAIKVLKGIKDQSSSLDPAIFLSINLKVWKYIFLQLNARKSGTRKTNGQIVSN